ncbi:NAD(P)/FAD-dependent oxidoreductase [Infirmifilum sp. NZ]|uniref:NAD(P)/FAD-dependent oxidoreductase n=1 Tax=Infirmifilum sp. NZ TaxID=2926850 RepID=UPI00279E22E9|nr:FAD-dependent oxidoreductase [Infirmifilum sp. NZ]UNQ74186.1 FAD-dependent oxidoreductase [Infirmifilum sp. NZ]
MTKKIVVVGGGFGGYYALKILRQSAAAESCEITLVDKSDRFVYLPSLPYLLSDKKTVDDITEPFEKISRRLGVSFIKGEVVGVSLKNKQVLLRSGESLEFDYLILSAGAQTEYYGIPGAETTIPSWRLEDYLQLKRRLEEAPPDHVCVAGGGLTGVEVAGELAEKLGREKVVIVEKMPNLLPTLNNQRASEIVESFLRVSGVKVIKGDGVKRVEDNRLILESGHVLECSHIVWSLGIRAPQISFDLPVETKGRGWLVVNPTLQLKGFEDVYAVGDINHFAYDSDCAMKMAEEAILQGKTAAKNVLRQLEGQKPIHVHKPIFLASKPKTLCSVGFNKAIMVWESKILFGRTPYISKMLIESIVMRDIKGKLGGGVATSLESTILRTISG